MVLKVLPIGMFGSNCFIVGDRGEGIIIDAGADPNNIISAVDESGLNIKYIVLTHGHIDHICSVDKLRTRLGASVLIHIADSEYLVNPVLSVSKMVGISTSLTQADRLLNDGDILEVGGLEFEIIHTPGHTPGCICIKVNNVLITGDTLFREGVGRTDLPGGNHEELLLSIRSKLMSLDKETVVYPGHGPSTTIGYEKEHNPYI